MAKSGQQYESGPRTGKGDPPTRGGIRLLHSPSRPVAGRAQDSTGAPPATSHQQRLRVDQPAPGVADAGELPQVRLPEPDGALGVAGRAELCG